jgi:hypothetical protein
MVGKIKGENEMLLKEVIKMHFCFVVATSLEMFTMRPNYCCLIYGTTAWVTLTVPNKLIPTIVCHTEIGISSNDLLRCSQPAGFAALDNLFPRPSPTTHIIPLLFLVGTIYVLSKTNIREVYFIDKQKMTVVIGVTALVTFFLMFAIS